MNRRRRRIASVLVLATALAALSAVGAGASQQRTRWSRISGPKGAGQQLGLARTGDGVLHVIWNRGNPAPTSIFDTRIASGGAQSGTQTVRTNWGGAAGLAALSMPDGSLRLFATGGASPGTPVGGVNTLTAPSSGQGWTLDQANVWGGPPAAASPFVGAAVKDGQPVTAWAGGGASSFRLGIGGGNGSQLCACSDTSADVVTDGGSGAVVVAGETIGGSGGTYVEQALPSVAGRVVLPSATQAAGDEGLAARTGAPGVFVAYSDGNRSGVAKPAMRLYRFGGGSRTIARGPFTVAKVFTGPAGRLWLAWGDQADGLFVTRTNRAAGKLEPVQRLQPPPGAGFLWNAQGEGTVGPLDLFVDTDTPDGRGFWHTHVLARFTLQARVKRTRSGATVTFTALDAGDPVAGVSVAVGGRHVSTNGSGKATLTLRHGSYAARATAGGYSSASVRFKA